MVNAEMDISPMMALPEEIRSVIFNLIPQTETVNLRLVCKTWNQEIQNNFEYDIDKLDENSPDFSSILQLRIKNLEILKLEFTPVFNLDGTFIFKHPKAIRTFLIGENAIVAQLNLHQLIGRFAENLRVLRLYVTPKIFNYQFPPGLSFHFKHLKLLIFTGVHVESEQCEDNPRSLLQVLENSSYPNLKILVCVFEDLTMTLEAKSRIVGNVLRLISKQGKYLEQLLVDFGAKSAFIELPIPLQEEELLRIKEIKTLKSISLHLLPIKGMKKFWIKFLSERKQLEQLHILGFSPNGPISISLIQQITQNNSATLQNLVILRLPLSPTDPPFDLSIFQNFKGLKELTLQIEYEARIARVTPEEPDVVNFHRLPQNLIELGLVGLKVSSEELLIAFRSNINTGDKGFKNLKKLTLAYCGDQGLFGINVVVFYEIMMTPRPSLTNLDFRRTVHQGGAALKTVLTQLQISEDTNFRFKRDSGEHDWKNCVDN